MIDVDKVVLERGHPVNLGLDSNSMNAGLLGNKMAS